MIVIVMGVSGSGKSTLGRALAGALGWDFVEGDDHHPPANVAKMAGGIALTDADRGPWLDRLHGIVAGYAERGAGAVLACSALKRAYRERLSRGLPAVRFVFLCGDPQTIAARLKARGGHFMPASLLDSQIATLEPPADAVFVAVDLATGVQVARVVAALGMAAGEAPVLQTATAAAGLAFPEGPRWHAGRLWFTDQHARTVHALDAGGHLATVTHTADLPGGLAWLPDGTPLVVYMTTRRVMALGDGAPAEYADLSAHAAFHCNDMVADRHGRLYVGNFGFDLHGGAPQAPAELVLVDPGGGVEVFARDVVFPNGSCITPDGGTLLVAETFAHRVSAFALDADGRMAGRGVWAELGAATPDGICLDAEDHLWVASPGTRELLRVAPGGAIRARCATTGTPYACMLGGDDGRTLYVCTAETDDPAAAAARRTGRIEQVPVATPHAGLP